MKIRVMKKIVAIVKSMFAELERFMQSSFEVDKRTWLRRVLKLSLVDVLFHFSVNMRLQYMIVVLFHLTKKSQSSDYLPFVSTLIKEFEVSDCQLLLSRGNLLGSTKVLKDLSMQLGRPCSLTFTVDLDPGEFVIGNHLSQNKTLTKSLYVFSKKPTRKIFGDVLIDHEVLFLNSTSGKWYEHYLIEGYVIENVLGKASLHDKNIKVI